MSEVSPQVAIAVGLSLVTAIGYAVATFGMKLTSGGLSGLGIAVVLTGFALAAIAEILLLQRFDLAKTYIIIITVETILIFAAALWIGETVSRSQLAGAALILAGLTLTLT